jgi:hypothetical protein
MNHLAMHYFLAVYVELITNCAFAQDYTILDYCFIANSTFTQDYRIAYLNLITNFDISPNH